ncbi:MAG: protein translocase subunit SecF [Leptospiraceae bacterium]|nr:protein translocase subunit SecF [Leptospiraceae bacterium]MDW7975589.1 protein translocase subunit SecF [Leptospiraceae bacterium]
MKTWKIIENRNTYFFVSIFMGLVFYGVTFSYYGGFKPSITFNGGIRVTIIFPPEQNKEIIESQLKEAGFQEFTVRLVDQKEHKYDIEFGPEVREQLKEKIKEDRTIMEELENILLPYLKIPKENIISREVISASYGMDLFQTALAALFWTLILITIYITFRFDFSFALGGTIALLHDLILTIGFIGITQIEPSIPVVAAVLTLLGYSINDTIIIFDRIRSKIRDKGDLINTTLINEAIRETFSRTIITSFLTMLSLIAIIISNAESLIDFSLILIFGIIIGTYSSIAIACPIMFLYEKFRQHKLHT